MARLHSFSLPAPFYHVELLELQMTERREGHNLRVDRLYLVDPRAPRGLRLLKSAFVVPASLVFPKSNADDSEVIE